MHLIKKSSAIVLFISLISCFVLYRSGFFERSSNTNEPETLATNTLTTSNKIEGEKRLVIDLETVLLIDTLNLTAKRSVLRKYILEDFSHRIIPSSKSIVLYTELPSFATENKKILKRLKANDIVRVNFTANRGLKSQKSDAALLDALYLIEKGELNVGSRLERYLDNEKTINLHWKTINNIITLNVNGTQLDVMANKSDVEEFFNWYDKFNKKRKTPMFSSSKSLIIPDSDDMLDTANKELKEDRVLFKQKLTEYLNITF